MSETVILSFTPLSETELARFRQASRPVAEAAPKSENQPVFEAIFGKSREDGLLRAIQPYMKELMRPGEKYCICFFDSPNYLLNPSLQKKINVKLHGAVQSYASGSERERVWFLYDASRFGNGREGFCMTDTHLYLSGKKPVCIPAKDAETRIKPGRDGRTAVLYVHHRQEENWFPLLTAETQKAGKIQQLLYAFCTVAAYYDR